MISKRVYLQKIKFQFLNFLNFFPENFLLADQWSAARLQNCTQNVTGGPHTDCPNSRTHLFVSGDVPPSRRNTHQFGCLLSAHLPESTSYDECSTYAHSTYDRGRPPVLPVPAAHDCTPKLQPLALLTANAGHAAISLLLLQHDASPR